MPQPDLSEFVKLSRPKKKPCPISAADLSKQDRAAFDAACADTSGLITVGAITQWLKSRGVETNNSAVVHHRRGSCSCNGS